MHSDAARKPRRKQYLQQYKGTLSCVLVMITLIVTFMLFKAQGWDSRLVGGPGA